MNNNIFAFQYDIVEDFNPNLFILGVAKSGTTALHAYLSSIENICMSDPKEPIFFECEFENGLDYYRNNYFSHWQGEEIIGESRHRNLYLPYIAPRIKQVNPEAKLIVILRNPSERAYSHWWHFYSRGQEDLGFKEAIKDDLARIEQGKAIDDEETINAYCSNVNGFLNGIYRTYVDTGYYYEQIKRYLDLFPRKNMLILNFQDLKENEHEVISRLAEFIGLSPDKFPAQISNRNEKKVMNTDSSLRKFLRSIGISKLIPRSLKDAYVEKKSEDIRSGYYDQETIKLLKQHYASHNDKLREIIDFDINSWY